MIRFLREQIWDMVLCVLLLFACGTCVCLGFYVPADQVGAYPVTLITAAVLVLLMTLAVYSKRTLLVGIGVLILLFAGMIVYSVGSGSSLFADDESNPFLRFLLMIITGIVIFAATRFRIGSVLLLPAGIIALCMIEFLYENHQVLWLLVFLIAGGAMIIYRNYINNVMHSRTLKTAQTSAVIYSIILCLLVAGLGAGIFFLIVKPLHPQAKELKLITKYLSLEVLEKIGVADIETINDPELMTDQLDDENDTTKQDTDQKDENLNDSSSAAENDESNDGTSPDRLNKRLKGAFHAIRYDWGIPQWILAILTIFALIAAAVLFKLYLRRRWLRAVQSKPADEQVRLMYAFFMRKFAQLKIRPVTGETPLDFAARTSDQLHVFRIWAPDPSGSLKSKGGFPELTDVIVRVEYGGQMPTEDDISLFETFYRFFYWNCREYLGRIQYIIRFFTL